MLDSAPRSAAARFSKRPHNQKLRADVVEKRVGDWQYMKQEDRRGLEWRARRKRAADVYKLYLQRVPIEVIAERKGLTVRGVKGIIAQRANFIDIKTAAELEAMLLTTIGKLAYEANDLVESLNAEEDELDRKFLAAASKSGNGGDEGGDAKWYEIEQTDYGPTPMTRKLSYRRAKAMLKKERMKARLESSYRRTSLTWICGALSRRHPMMN
jgi:hypothetical protein